MRRRIIFGFAVLVVIAIGLFWYLATTKYLAATNPLARDALERGDYGALAKTYLQSDFAIEERPWHGSAQAPISVIVVLDMNNPVSNELLAVVHNRTADRVEQGVVRIGVKYHITDEDYAEAKDTFIYAAAARCSERDASWMNAVQALIRGDETPQTVRANVGEAVFESCMESPALVEDVFHTRTQRTVAPSVMIGTDTRAMTTLYGAPDVDDLEQAIRSYEIRFGI